MNTKNWITSAVVLVVLVVGVLFILDSKKGLNITPKQGASPSESLLENQDQEAAKATQSLIDEAMEKQGISEDDLIQDATGEGEELAPGQEGSAGEIEDEPTTVEVIDNTSPIDVATGNVVNDEGKKVDTSKDADPEDAAKVSGAITEEDLPENGIVVRMYVNKIESSEFTVQAGQAVNLSAIGMDDYLHAFKFKDDELAGMFLSVVLDEVRSTTFNAPTAPGEYVFYDAMSDHEQKGAKGVMIVQ